MTSLRKDDEILWQQMCNNFQSLTHVGPHTTPKSGLFLPHNVLVHEGARVSYTPPNDMKTIAYGLDHSVRIQTKFDVHVIFSRSKNAMLAV